MYITPHKFSKMCGDCNNQPSLRKIALMGEPNGVAILQKIA